MSVVSGAPAVRAFCPGQAKSGTASLAGLLRNYHTAHEPEREKTINFVVRASESHPRDSVRRALLDRDARLNLEYDIAWANQFILPQLVEAFPSAKFVVLVRDCFTWVESVLGHLDSRVVPQDVLDFLAWWFRPDMHPASASDQRLIERGLFPIRAYLHAWNRHIESCLTMIPVDRRIIIRTHELSRSHQALADFLEIPIGSLSIENGHRNRSTRPMDLGDLVDESYLHEVCMDVCGRFLEHFFPEVKDRDSALGLFIDECS